MSSANDENPDLSAATISDPEIAALSYRCSECNIPVDSTGTANRRDGVAMWFVEYWCPNEKIVLGIYTPEGEAVVERVLARRAEADESS